MRHLKLAIVAVAAVLLLASCQKRFVCVCPFHDNTPPYNAEFNISAKDKDEAVKRCDNYDIPDIQSDCSLK